MSFLDRVQGYLHEKARAQREVIVVGPFTLYLHVSRDHVSENWAMPHEAAEWIPLDTVEATARFFERRARTPQFQSLDTFAPLLGTAMNAAGYGVVTQQPVLICTKEWLRLPNNAPPLSMVVISADSDLDDVAEGWTVNAQGFDAGAAAATLKEAEAFRQTLISSRAITAKLDGEAVGAGMFTELHEGVTELVGITTVQPMRGRGIGAAVTAYLTELAFENGADLAFLVAASPQASRVYGRVGYKHVANLVAWSKE